MKKDNRLIQAIQNSHKLLFCPIQSHYNNSTTSRTHSSISKKNECLKKLFNKWEINHSDELLANSLLLGIRYCANNLFAFKNNLTENQKYNHLKTMIVHSETQRLIPFYKPNSKLDSVYKTIISQKRALLLYLILKIIK